jgi:hypothetical protein
MQGFINTCDSLRLALNQSKLFYQLMRVCRRDVEGRHKHASGSSVKETDDRDRDQLIKAQSDVTGQNHDGQGMESGLLPLVNSATTEYGTLFLPP